MQLPTSWLHVLHKILQYFTIRKYVVGCSVSDYGLRLPVHEYTLFLGHVQRKDLLQLMIDASDSETQQGLKKGEIVVDSMVFILAGYETTSTTLTFATYLLAANADVQERLANEIHEYFEENPVSRFTHYSCSGQ